MKLKNWCGFQAIWAWKGAWMLGFGLLTIGNAVFAQPERPVLGLRVTIGAAIDLGPTHREQRWPEQIDTFEFVLPDQQPIRVGCETTPVKRGIASLKCSAGSNTDNAQREPFSVDVIVGRCADSGVKTSDGRKVWLVVCVNFDQRAKPQLT